LIVWNQIAEVITSSQLNLQLYYVKAHSGDVWNDFIDAEIAKIHHNNDASIITLLTNHMDNIKFSLKWNNIIIEQSPRKFISLTSKVTGFEEFFNLARNTKYRRTNVDWESTFFTLSALESSNVTTLKASFKKA
jgi:hypothetical protein